MHTLNHILQDRDSAEKASDYLPEMYIRTILKMSERQRHGTFWNARNFSFGDLLEEEAIQWTWEFLTEVVGLDPNRLYPSVYEDDAEAFEIWNKKMDSGRTYL